MGRWGISEHPSKWRPASAKSHPGKTVSERTGVRGQLTLYRGHTVPGRMSLASPKLLPAQHARSSIVCLCGLKPLSQASKPRHNHHALPNKRRVRGWTASASADAEQHANPPTDTRGLCRRPPCYLPSFQPALWTANLYGVVCKCDAFRCTRRIPRVAYILHNILELPQSKHERKPPAALSIKTPPLQVATSSQPTHVTHTLRVTSRSLRRISYMRKNIVHDMTEEELYLVAQ